MKPKQIQTKSIARQITEHSKDSGKTYKFDDQHDLTKPVNMWFQESHVGLILFVVFYSQACRWSRCLGCNLPSTSSRKHVSYKHIISQVDSIFRDTEVIRRHREIHKIIVSNNGSVLDQTTFSSVALMYLFAQVTMNLPNLRILSIETRPEYVEFAELEFISRALCEADKQANLEIAVGFEALDDRIRNQIFHKGLTLDEFENLIRQAAPYRYQIKTYFMQKPVWEMSDAEAIKDIRQAIDYLSAMVKKHDIAINMHLNPTYVARGTAIEKAFQKGLYTPPSLVDVAEALRNARGKPLTVFIGLSDEGLAVEGGSFIQKGQEDLISDLEEFNRTQNYDILDWICQNKD